MWEIPTILLKLTHMIFNNYYPNNFIQLTIVKMIKIYLVNKKIFFIQSNDNIHMYLTLSEKGASQRGHQSIRHLIKWFLEGYLDLFLVTRNAFRSFYYHFWRNRRWCICFPFLHKTFLSFFVSLLEKQT